MTDSTPPQFELAEVPQTSRPVLARLLQLYLYEMSAFDGAEIGPDGRYAYAYLDHYWFEPGRYPFLVVVAARPAGFALVRTLDPTGPVYSMAEFFILRPHRRRGLGGAVAWALFDRFPGHWHVAYETSNLPAGLFWRRTIAAYTGGDYAETEATEVDFGGRVPRFQSG